jgi:hypothetical protein
MRIKFMRQIIRKLKTIYYFIFTQLAYRCLRRRNGIPSNVSKNINLVCTFGLNNGLTNGANYNFLALEKLGYIVRKVDITPAIRNFIVQPHRFFSLHGHCVNLLREKNS